VVVGGHQPSADVAIKTSPPAWWAVQNVRPSLRVPVARRSHGSTSLSAKLAKVRPSGSS
jgi:hypothetical protein